MGRRFQAFAIAVALTIAAIAAAQVRVNVRLVNVIATVTDTQGRYIPNLAVEDFVLEEDGKPRPISHFSQDRNVPVSVGILLDTSGSMASKIRTAVEAVDRFIRQIHPDDEIFLFTFSGQPVLRQDFTGDREKLSQALKRVNATGGTALYDALSAGLTKIRNGSQYKHAMLVITDGQDTASAVKLDDVLRNIRESELLVYPIGISPLTHKNPGDEVDLKVLQALADSSGGRAFLIAETLINHGDQIAKVLDSIAEELRSQYTLGFYPAQLDDSRSHQIRVRVRTGDNVRARRGYASPAS
jgi:Ca-activated chloride channel family protein